MKIFIVLMATLSVVNVFAEAKKPCIINAKEHQLEVKNENGDCKVKKCVTGYDVDTSQNKCIETQEHKTCKEQKANWVNGKCTCLKTTEKWNGSKCVQTEKAQEKAKSALEKDYNKDIDALIEAYNTVVKKYVSQCKAKGGSIKNKECTVK